MAATDETELIRSDAVPGDGAAEPTGQLEPESTVPSEPPEITDEVLRPALEVAFAVAVAGSRMRPPVAAPPGLRKYLKFQKLPAAALPVVRKAVEEDSAFRERAARVATVELAGEVGRRWLARPDGWEIEVVELLDAAAADDSAVTAAQSDRAAIRKRDAAEQAASRARVALVTAQEALAGERERRLAAERATAEATHRAARLEAEVASARQETRRARDQADAARATLDSLRDEQARNQQRIDELQTRLESEIAARVAAQDRVSGLPPAPADQRDRNMRDEPAVAAALASLTQAAGGLHDLARALEATSRALGYDGTAQPPAAAPVPTVSTPRGRDAQPRRRTPLAIPGGLLGDSDEVALHLVRQANATLVVDGYNVAKLGWPDQELADQRDRLLDALEDLVRRVGVRTIVVFDGADVPCAPTGRRLLRVRFTPAGVLADDEIRDLASTLPSDEPVVVATNDQEVVRGVRAAGANVITSQQLLSISRR